jgi:hypothetical protein
VGHDTLFIKHAKAPVTCSGRKGPGARDNPLAALYMADGYYKRLYGFYNMNIRPSSCSDLPPRCQPQARISLSMASNRLLRKLQREEAVYLW